MVRYILPGAASLDPFRKEEQLKVNLQVVNGVETSLTMTTMQVSIRLCPFLAMQLELNLDLESTPNIQMLMRQQWFQDTPVLSTPFHTLVRKVQRWPVILLLIFRITRALPLPLDQDLHTVLSNRLRKLRAVAVTRTTIKSTEVLILRIMVSTSVRIRISINKDKRTPLMVTPTLTTLTLMHKVTPMGILKIIQRNNIKIHMTLEDIRQMQPRLHTKTIRTTLPTLVLTTQ